MQAVGFHKVLQAGVPLSCSDAGRGLLPSSLQTVLYVGFFTVSASLP